MRRESHVKIKRYFAPTMREAMRRVRADQGADAVILGSESRDGGIELVAAIDYDAALLQQAVRRHGGAARPVASAAGKDGAPARPAPAVWEQDPQLQRLQRELADVRRMLSTSLEQQTDATLRAHPHRARALRNLEALGIDSGLAREIAAHMPEQAAGPQQRNLPLALLARRLRVPADAFFEGPTRLALIGPTGAGKTTTLAKLAARAVAADGAREVTLISMDGHRAGAEAQIGVYARLLGVPLRIVRGADELATALDDCADCRHVFVDSAGTGPADGRLAALLPELAAMKRGPRSLQTLLVLPANVQREDLLGAVARFAPAGPAAAALTKIDECSRFGGALSALIGTRTPLAWLADGQAVPRDLHRAAAGETVLRAARQARAAQQQDSLEQQALRESVHA
jgi:flagellar biosynthesis protein FlhF